MRSLFFLWALQGFAAFNLTWGTPAINLDANPPIGDTDSNATIAIDPQGNAIASWSRTVGGSASEDIWVALFNHSQRVWTGAVKISGGGSAANSQVAIDRLGNAIVVWEEGFPTQIKYRLLSADGVWSPDISMPPNNIQPSVNAQTFPQISIDASQKAILIWMEYFSGKEHIFSATKPYEMPWITHGEISSGENNASLIPLKSLALSHSSGIAIAAWEEFDQNTNTTRIHAARFMENNWTEPLTISDINGKGPAVGIDPSGNAVIVWSQNNQIHSKTIRNNILSESAVVVSDSKYSAIHPDIGMDGDGNAILVFERIDAMHKFISGSTFSKRTGLWTKPLDISAPSPANIALAGYPVLSVNSIGDGVVIWKESSGENIVIQGSGFSLGTWSNTKTLSSLDSDSGAKTPAYDIAVVLNDNGNILAIWPEDPNKNGTFQIKSTAGIGLANLAPLPPMVSPETVQLGGVISGKQVIHRFPAHSDIINILTWENPGGVQFFNVYRNNLASLIATVGDSYFEDHQRTPRELVTYLITSVDGNGQESAPMTIVVQPR